MHSSAYSPTLKQASTGRNDSVRCSRRAFGGRGRPGQDLQAPVDLEGIGRHGHEVLPLGSPLGQSHGDLSAHPVGPKRAIRAGLAGRVSSVACACASGPAAHRARRPGRRDRSRRGRARGPGGRGRRPGDRLRLGRSPGRARGHAGGACTGPAARRGGGLRSRRRARPGPRARGGDRGRRGRQRSPRAAARRSLAAADDDGTSRDCPSSGARARRCSFPTRTRSPPTACWRGCRWPPGCRSSGRLQRGRSTAPARSSPARRCSAAARSACASRTWTCCPACRRAPPDRPRAHVTAAEGPRIQELAGVPALEKVRDVVTALTEHERALVAEGLLMGW